MSRLFFYIFSLICIRLISSCAHSTDYASSKPVGATEFLVFDPIPNNYVYRANKLELKDFALYLKPYNDIQTFDFMMLLFLPVLVDFKDKELFKQDQFKIRLGVKTYIDGLTIDPEKVTLKINSEEIRAKSAQPVCDKSLSFQEISDMSEKGIYNICLCQNGKLKIIPLDNIWYCFDLIFDTKIPMPDAKYSISISGIKVKGTPNNSIDISFEKEEWTSFF